MEKQVALFAFFVCATTPTIACSQTRDSDVCKDVDYVPNPTLVIDVCTNLINGWHGETEQLVNLLLARGSAYIDKGYSDQAIADFGQAIMLNPLSAEAHYDEASAYIQKDMPDLALKEYNEAIRLKPGYARAYNNRGYVHYQKGDLLAAFRDFSKVIDLDPTESATAFSNRGQVFLLVGDCANALHDFGEAHSLNSNYPIPQTSSWSCTVSQPQ